MHLRIRTSGEGVHLYFHTYVGSGHFGGGKISIFWAVFRKLYIFGGLMILRILFSGKNKIELVLGVISTYFRDFS